MKNIHKSFSSNEVLRNVDFELREGEVHALIGENGAGKSTLIKILGGIFPADKGDIYLNGKKVNIQGIGDARKCGISIIHQELMLMQHLSIAENIFVGHEIINRGCVDLRKQEDEAQKLLDSYGLAYRADTPLINLTIAQQQIVEIIRSISFNAKIIAMDEPTSSLSDKEAEMLFNLIDDLRKRKLGIIFVSHRLSDIFRVADRITVLRDGICVGTKLSKDTNNEDLVRMMVGRDLKHYYSRQKANVGRVMLEVKNLSDGGLAKDVSFDVNQGEILGVSGLVGAGRSETMNCIFGISKRYHGKVIVDGKEVNFKSPRDALQSGISLVCEDRKLSGLFLKQSVRFNLTITILDKFFNKFRYKEQCERKIAKDYINKLMIKIVDMEQIVNYLSGGNQQKVLIGRWLACKNPILLLDEPTRGVDIKTKEDIYRIMGDLAKEGTAIIFVSSELPELINVCDRIMVMSNGKTTGTLKRDKFSQEAVMMLATKGL